MTDPPPLVYLPFPSWLSVPEGPPDDVWEAALSSALETAAGVGVGEGAGDDSHPLIGQPLPDDASTPAWERTDGDDAS